MKLNYIGKNDFGNPVYRDEEDILWVDIDNCTVKLEEDEGADKSSLYTLSNNEMDGEPNHSMSYLKKYQNIDVELCFEEVQKPSVYEFTYMMLGRLQSDCRYFLGNGNRCEKHLWGITVNDHIDEMKKLYNQLPTNEKPEWLTWEDILQFEKEMG